MLANVKIEQDNRDGITHKVIVNGREIQRVNHIDLNYDVSEVPQVNVGIVGGFDFEGMADIRFDYLPYTVKESCKILRDELLKHGDLYNAFVASINSVLMDGIQCEPPNLMDRKAKQIMDRLIGDEN